MNRTSTILRTAAAVGSCAVLAAVGSALLPAQAAPAAAPTAAAPPVCSSGAGTNPAPGAESVVGLTTAGTLVCFGLDAPTAGTTIGPITGLTGDIGLVGIDFRVQDGKLYGVGNAGGIYTLSTTDASATKVGLLSVPLGRGLQGVDFNPAANALRIVGDDGQNLRVPFNVGTAPGSPSATTTVDTTLNNGGSPATTVTGILGAAYTNNDLVAETATTLFDLNAATNQVMIQSPANNGIVAATGTFAPDAVDGDLDVYTPSAGRDRAFALIVRAPARATRLYGVDLLSGRLARTYQVPAGTRDIAVPIAQ